MTQNMNLGNCIVTPHPEPKAQPAASEASTVQPVAEPVPAQPSAKAALQAISAELKSLSTVLDSLIAEL